MPKPSKSLEEMRLSPTLMLLSHDKALVNLRSDSSNLSGSWFATQPTSRKILTQPNVRLVIFDDESVEESDRSWLLAQIRQHFLGHLLLARNLAGH
jgi:hypothetical protein